MAQVLVVAAQAFGLGLVAGMRAMLPLALLSWFPAPPFAWLGSWVGRAATGVLALGELIADKLPTTPSRLSPGPLIARLVIGGASGGFLLARGGQPSWLGVGLGALGAAAGAFAGNRLRAQLVRRTGLSDTVFAVGEDLLAIALGVWAVR